MNNKLQNPLQILQKKTQSSWSGCIEIESPQDLSICWNVYLLQGKIQYVNSATGQQIRLNYLYQRFNLQQKCPQLADDKDTSEYSQLCEALSQKQMEVNEIKKLLFRLVREGLVNVLSIEQALIRFVPQRRINKALVSFTFEQLTAKLEGQIQSWKQITHYIHSPFSRLYLDQKQALKFYKVWKPQYNTPELEPIASHHKLSSFVSLFVGKSCLYRIATQANVDVYYLAKLLQQSIAEGLITLFPFKELTPEEISQKQKPKVSPSGSNSVDLRASSLDKNNNSPRLIVCIDDSKTVQKQVKLTLEAVGYQVIGIVDPTVALKQLAQHQPAVIFLDINMPHINGYDLCSLLRKSQKFKEVPIVMLTGRDGMIDRVRAKIVGATDYLTKPCDPNKLITLAKALEKSTVTV